MIVGRRVERAAIERFATDTDAPARALVIEGDAGIGKTTLWREGVERLSATGMVVLAARPTESETALSFAALADLLEAFDDELLGALPEPQRRALDAALQRGPVDEPSSRLALARGTLALLRAAAASAPLAVAIDDCQWLDRATGQIVAFALRRGGMHRLLLSLRTEAGERLPLTLDSSPALHIERLRLGPLDAAEVGQLAVDELGVHLSRPLLLDLHQQTGGNPFYALEIVRSGLNEHVDIEAASALPVPESLAALLRARLRALSPAAGDAVLLCSASSHPTTAVIERAAGSFAGIAEALEMAVLRVDGDRLRFDHPLLASVVYASATPEERRDAHRRLAEVLSRDERAIHLALAADGPDEDVAGELLAAAERARRIAAWDSAATLGEEALRLTPDGSLSLAGRVVAAAEYQFAAGNMARSRELLEQAVATAQPGPDRAAILLSLGIVRYRAESLQVAAEVFRQAFDESAGSPALQAQIEHAHSFVATGLGDLQGGIDRARSAVRLAEALGDPGLLSLALGRVAAAEFFSGFGLDRDMFQRAIDLEEHVGDTLPEWLPSFHYASACGFVDDDETARAVFERFHRPVIERDGELALPLLVFQSQFECRAGNWSTADSISREAVELSLLNVSATTRAFALGSRALVAAHLGRVEEARSCAKEGLRHAEESGAIPPVHLILWALGFLELSLGDHRAAHEHLAPLAKMILAIGANEPGVVRFLPDEIEALEALGQLEEARVVLQHLDERARAVERVSMMAAACRCRAQLAAAQGEFEQAQAALEEALAHHARLAQPFELARTLLTAGRIERRAHRRGRARETLGRALEIFDALGAPLWAEKTAAELDRVPGRRPAAEPALTATERRVAELVGAGLANKEIAAALFVSVRTVEANLTRIYRKLGVRSRADLVRRL